MRKSARWTGVEHPTNRLQSSLESLAQATATYSTAYNSSASAADFYQFVKTLETYTKTLGKDTTTIFTSDSDLFRLFKHIEAPTKP